MGFGLVPEGDTGIVAAGGIVGAAPVYGIEVDRLSGGFTDRDGIGVRAAVFHIDFDQFLKGDGVRHVEPIGDDARISSLRMTPW